MHIRHAQKTHEGGIGVSVGVPKQITQHTHTQLSHNCNVARRQASPSIVASSPLCVGKQMNKVNSLGHVALTLVNNWPLIYAIRDSRLETLCTYNITLILKGYKTSKHCVSSTQRHTVFYKLIYVWKRARARTADMGMRSFIYTYYIV